MHLSVAYCQPVGYLHRVDSQRAQPETDDWLVRAGKVVNRCFTRIYHRLEVHSPARLPRTGPGLLVCNHTSGLDPLLIQSACRRTIVWMMAREFYDMPSMNWIFRRIEAIPVGRGGRDMAATRSALRALKAGRIVGIFPEGRIEPTRHVMPFQTGVALMAIRTGISIYPACLDGTQRNKGMLSAFLHAQSAAIAFGPPLDFSAGDPDRKALDEATARIQTAVERLMNELSFCHEIRSQPRSPAPGAAASPPSEANYKKMR